MKCFSASRQDGDRPRAGCVAPGTHAAQGSGPHQHAGLAAAEAADAARHRPLLAAGAGSCDQRRPGPDGGRPRLPGILAGLPELRGWLRNGHSERPVGATVHGRCVAEHAERAHAPAIAGGTHRSKRIRGGGQGGDSRPVYLRAAFRETAGHGAAGPGFAAFPDHRRSFVV